MADQPKNPLFYRPFAVTQIRPEGVDIKVEANDMERAMIATDFHLPAVHSLVGEFRLTGRPERVKVVGRVEASIQQICVVSLEPFDSILTESVELVFAETSRRKTQDEQVVMDADEPDPIINGQIDLGAVALEFMALGLEPYPRKPGISFDDVKKSLGLKDDTISTIGDFAADNDKGSS